MIYTKPHDNKPHSGSTVQAYVIDLFLTRQEHATLPYWFLILGSLMKWHKAATNLNRQHSKKKYTKPSPWHEKMQWVPFGGFGEMLLGPGQQLAEGGLLRRPNECSQDELQLIRIMFPVSCRQPGVRNCDLVWDRELRWGQAEISK